MQTKIKLIKRSIYVFLLLYPLCISAQISKFYLPDNGNVLPISKPNDIKLSVDLPTVGEIHTKVNLGYSNPEKSPGMELKF